MKFRDRIRKIIKWSALALTAVLLICWVGSNWYHFGWVGKNERWYAGCATGYFGGFVGEAGRRPGTPATLAFGKVDPSSSFTWWLWSVPDETMRVQGIAIRSFGAPLWAPLVVAGAIAFAAWGLDSRATRRARAGCCSKCGYHRAGLNPDAACPECGTSIPA